MRRRFTREFKLTVLQELETASLTEVCQKHSVDVSTVSNWRIECEIGHPCLEPKETKCINNVCVGE